MELRNLGKSGLLVSVVGLGGNNFGGRADLEASRAVIFRALDQGINFIDTADMYSNRGGSERALGEILGEKRKDIILATKFGHLMDDAGVKKGASRRYIMNAVEDSLSRLKTDWIDLYQIHRPDPLTPIEETMRALDDLVRQGKVRYIGCSNFAAWQVADAQWTARAGGLEHFISAQDEYSLLAREIDRELLPAIQHFEMGLLPFFPLASGLLTGKYKRNEAPPAGSRLAVAGMATNKFYTPKNLEMVEKLDNFARERGHTLLELAMSWLACRPGVVSVIAGATKAEQIDMNVQAAGWKISAEDMAAVDKITG